MGNTFRGNRGGVQEVGQPSIVYAPQQPVLQPQPQLVQQQPQFVQQQPQFVQQQPQFVQQPIVQPQPQFVQSAPPQFLPQQSGQYRSFLPPPPSGGFRPSYPSGSSMPRYPGSPFSLPHGHDASSSFENDAFLANLTGWSPQDIERLRHEFFGYANPFGVIDRDGFRKLYIASLLNVTWEVLEHDAEAAFRNFDINQTGVLDFNEYITACSRLAREVNASYSSPPPMNPPYNY